MPFLIFSLIIAVMYSLSALQKADVGTPGKDMPVAQSVSVMEGVGVISTRGGQRQWALSSRSVELSQGRAALDGVRAELTGLGLDINAPAGDYDLDSGGIVLRGGVDITGEGVRLRAPDVEVDPSGGELRSTGQVVIDGQGYRVIGTGMVAQGQEVRLLSDVKAVFY